MSGDAHRQPDFTQERTCRFRQSLQATLCSAPVHRQLHASPGSDVVLCRHAHKNKLRHRCDGKQHDTKNQYRLSPKRSCCNPCPGLRSLRPTLGSVEFQMVPVSGSFFGSLTARLGDHPVLLTQKIAPGTRHPEMDLPQR